MSQTEELSRRAVGGVVLGKEAVENDEVPDIGAVIEVNGLDHVVVGKTGHYKLEKDRWNVVLKVKALREPKIVGSEYGEPCPDWVREAVEGD